MHVPAPVEKLDVADPLFHHAACQKAVVGESGLADLGAIHGQSSWVLLANVHDFRNTGLHPESQFVLLDSGSCLRVAKLGKFLLINGFESIQASSSIVAGHSVGVIQKEDRLGSGSTLHPLINRWQNTAAPDRLAGSRIGSARDQNDEARQVLILTAKPVSCPGPDGRTAGPIFTGVEEKLGRGVVDLFGDHGIDDAHVVGMLGHPRYDFAHPLAGLAMAGKLPGRSEHHGPTFDERKPFAIKDLVRTRLQVMLDQRRLPVKKILLRRRSAHVQVDDPLGFGGMMRRPDRERAKLFCDAGFRRF